MTCTPFAQQGEIWKLPQEEVIDVKQPKRGQLVNGNIKRCHGKATTEWTARPGSLDDPEIWSRPCTSDDLYQRIDYETVPSEATKFIISSMNHHTSNIGSRVQDVGHQIQDMKYWEEMICLRTSCLYRAWECTQSHFHICVRFTEQLSVPVKQHHG